MRYRKIWYHTDGNQKEDQIRKMKYVQSLALAAGILASVVDAAAAEDARLTWVLADDSVVTETRRLEEKGDVSGLTVPAAEIRAKKAKGLVVTPSFGHAAKGESGYWFSPFGYYGEWDCEKGAFVAARERMSMPMYGWATPRGAYLAIITGLAHYPRLKVEAKDGRYSVSCELDEELCKEATEDFRIEFHRRASGTGYGALAAIYRDYQLARGAVKPLAERVKANPILKRAVEAPEIRIRQAWKPVPSPVKWQTPTNEPPVKPVVTFDRLQDIVRELKRQGVADAELCLVGWNIGGHDGRWPQYFPAEPKLGGDAGLKAAVRCAHDAGYLIVPHGNFIEGYTIGDNWDWANAAKDEKGEPQLAGKLCWGGGQPVRLCPRRAYEVYCTGLMKQLADVGFTGIGYFDVVSILRGTNCFDPAHPCTRAEGAAWWGKYAAEVQKTLGGFASEGSVDHFAGNLDSVLYASMDTPEKIAELRAKGGLAKAHVPIFQLVYNGIIVQNPFTTTVNFTAQPRTAFLKFIEYGGRPNFYFYSKFMSDPKRDWMGKNDLRCGTDEELRWSVGKIREGAEIYAKLRHLQYAFMTNHERLASGVTRTTWSTGESIVVNDTDASYALPDGTAVPARDWRLIQP